MPELKRQDNLKVAIQVDGSTFITSEEGVLYEYVTDNEVFIYVNSKENNKEIKIKITK